MKLPRLADDTTTVTPESQSLAMHFMVVYGGITGIDRMFFFEFVCHMGLKLLFRFGC